MLVHVQVLELLPPIRLVAVTVVAAAVLVVQEVAADFVFCLAKVLRSLGQLF